MLAAAGSLRAVDQSQQQPAATPPAPAQALPRQQVLRRYCVSCHNEKLKTAGLALDTFDVEHPSVNPEVWERVATRLRAGSMPPTGLPRPDASTYDEMATWLETELDRAWAAAPNPGRIAAVHRLNRTQYNNA